VGGGNRLVPSAWRTTEVARNLTEEQVVEFWRAYRQGESASRLARRFDIGRMSVHDRIRRAGGISPTLPCRSDRHLRLEEREETSRGLAAGESLRRIAKRVGRSPSMISREVAANGGRGGYRATRADRDATVRRRRTKVCNLAAAPRLAALVDNKLREKWSPEQIAGWLKRVSSHAGWLWRRRVRCRWVGAGR
jgi:hypothetical protein